jgi:hypothetical protein
MSTAAQIVDSYLLKPMQQGMLYHARPEPCSRWNAALGRQVSGAGNFFDLGGNSSRMQKFLRRLCARLQRKLFIVSLLLYPTARSLAGSLSETPAAIPGDSAFQDRGAKALTAIARQQKARMQ